jgi:hypothetical protein
MTLTSGRFDWLGRIVLGRLHGSVIVDEIGGQDVAVAIVEE